MSARAYDKEVKKTVRSLGSDNITCLAALFESLQGVPPSVDRIEYRASHRSELKKLDSLENSTRWIRQNNERSKYTLSAFSLPLLKNERSQRLITVMNDVFIFLHRHYTKSPKSRVVVRELSDITGHDSSEVMTAIYCLSQMGLFQSRPSSFPFEQDAELVISESILAHDNIYNKYADLFRSDRQFMEQSHHPLALPHDQRKYSLWHRLTRHPIVAALTLLAGLYIGFAQLIDANSTIAQFLAGHTD